MPCLRKYNLARMERCLTLGLCTSCGDVADHPYQKCAQCREIHAQAKRARRKQIYAKT